MKKLWQVFFDNALFVLALGLIAFIPLYPKVPLLDVRHTWVYIRLEDFLVLGVLLWWGVLLIRRRIRLVSPITTAILSFWLIGALATIHGVLLIYPRLTGVHPNVGFLSMLRRIEYMSVFFVSFASVTDASRLRSIVATLAVTVLAVSLYGIGQKYVGLPAFLTMNEEFAKGIPIRLSPLSRVSSTFSGHYDLAAYFVLTIPILLSVVLGAARRWVRLALLGICAVSVLVLFMTVSRISLIALFFAVGLVLSMHKRRVMVVGLPLIVLLVAAIAVASPKIVERFRSTLRQTDIVVDAATGDAIGHARLVPRSYFTDKTVQQVFSTNVNNLYAHATPAAAMVIPPAQIEDPAVLYAEPNAPTGENLPQGTGYVNLPLAPVVRKIRWFYFEPIPSRAATKPGEVFVINGSFLIKRAYAYDLSFTTRFQGEWPRALDAFRRNIFFGSGYGSVGLAVDNSYLRMLGEVGLVGLGAFLTVLGTVWLSMRKALQHQQNTHVRSFLIGLSAGLAGLSLNGLFIDVFEASKVAFVLWLLVGAALGVMKQDEEQSTEALRQGVTLLTSPGVVLFSLFVVAVILFRPMVGNMFVGDDFTWLRWAAQGKLSAWYLPFLDAGGFFYRPGAKLYFLLMYSLFWLNENAYHAVSLALHVVVTALVFALARAVFKGAALALFAAGAFLLMSGHAEPVFWISGTGILFASFFSLLGLVSFLSGHTALALFSLLSAPLFHEVGIVAPLLCLAYAKVYAKRFTWVLFAPTPVYLVARFLAGSHWLSGDYNYHFGKLLPNAMGNTVGYVLLSLIGPSAGPVMELLRGSARDHVFVASLLAVAFGFVAWRLWRRFATRTVRFCGAFFLISLLPFLGLGTITSRYSYLSSVGIALLTASAARSIYVWFLRSGRAVAVLSMGVLASTLVLLHLIAHQQTMNDWRDAAETSRRFIISMEGTYEDYWKREPMEFHFVNPPIRTGEAWIFPVGIPDALWFILRNEDIRVFTHGSVEEAFSAVSYAERNQKVFEFLSSGRIVERVKPQSAL